MRIKLHGWLVLAGILAWRAGVEAEGLPVFSDDFSTSALLAEKWRLAPVQSWKIMDGALVTDGKKGTRVAFARASHDGPVEVRVRVKAIEFQKGQWCGLRVRGIIFSVREEGFWHVYNIKGKKRALGNMRSDERPRPGEWYKFRVVHRGSRYQWFVNGKKKADFLESNRVIQQEGLLALATSGPAAAFDDVQVFALPEGGPPRPNLLRNSSFENVQDHLPVPWIPRYISPVPPEVLWRDWRVVDAGAYHGMRCLRIAGGIKGSNGFFSGITGIAMGRPCTFSIYLRSGRAGCKVRLVMWERLGRQHFKPVRLTTEWRRYSFTLKSPAKSRLRAGVQLQDDGVVWADAAQLELGEAATQYRLCMLDEAGARTPERSRIPGAKVLRFVETPPRLDGRLDDAVWNDASSVWPLVLPGGRAPQERTDAYMVFSRGVLYIGMRCHDSRVERIKAKVTEHDGNVYVDDSVEIFLDTRHDRSSYFHLAVNSKGVRFDAGPGRDRSWDGRWSARTVVGKDSWSVEVALPLSSLELTGGTADEWGVNLCRHLTRLEEFSSVAVTRVPNFHRVDLYPVLKWPDPKVLRSPQVIPIDLVLVRGSGGGCRLSGRLFNRTGSAKKVCISGELGGVSWSAGPVSLSDGEVRAFSVPIKGLQAGDAMYRMIKGQVREMGDDGRVIRSFHVRVPVRSIFSGVLERSVYAAEKDAIFIADVLLPEKELKDARVTIKLEKAPGLSFEFSGLKRRSELPFSIEKVSPGVHPVTALLLDGNGKEAGRVNTRLVRLARTERAVAVDRSRRCLLVDGEPYLVIAPLYQFWPHTRVSYVERMLNQAADSGFKTVMVVCRTKGKGADAVWGAVFERARMRGLMVIAWPAGFPRLVPEGFINRWKSHPALLAWMPIDEPELYARPEDVIGAVSHFRRLDPYHPVYMNNTVMGIPSRFAGLPGDILSIDDYLTNRPGRKVIEMVRDIEMMNGAGIPLRRPVWMFLAGNNLYNHDREPSAGEQVAQTYGCIVAGASGLKYFMGYPVSPGHWAAMMRTNSELLRLGPVIFSRESAPLAECSALPVRFIVRRSGSNVYIVAVNVEARGVKARFSVLGGGTRDVVVLFEGRSLRMASGVFEDAFGPHERHVYRFHEE